MDRRPVLQSTLVVLPPGDNCEPDLFDDVDVSTSNDRESLVSGENSDDTEEKRPPVDKYNFVFAVCYLLGTSTLLPWYFFITCNDYWMYRFRDLHNGSTSTYSYAIVLPDEDDGRDKLQADFMSYISIASTIPSTIFLFVNLFFLKGFSIHGRVLLSFILLLALFVETTVLILFNTDEWQWYFFIVTLTTVVALNMATALLQAALCGIVMRFPVRYISAFSSGQSLAGILAAVFRIWSLCVNVTPTISTFMYFTFADVIILIAFLGYLATRKTGFYDFYITQKTTDRHRQAGVETVSTLPRIDYWDLQRRIKYPCLALFFCFVITTCVYPSITVLVVSSNISVIEPFSKFFVPVISYLLYSVCEYTGRTLAGFIQKPKGIYVFWISLARVVFIPLLMLCNALPRHHLPVLVKSDFTYAIIVVGLGLTNGYLANLTFILMPKFVYSNEHEVASTILVIWLASGLSVGSLLSFPLVNLL